MGSNTQHIISRCKWNTVFDQKTLAAELQQRISDWGKTQLPREALSVFEQLCPADETWKIDVLELDLGSIEYEELEQALSEGVRSQLLETLSGYLQAGIGQHQVEVTRTGDSQMNMVSCFLLYGVLPWNYQTADGSVNDMLAKQLRTNNAATIDILKRIGATTVMVRKRMAWQLNENNLVKLLRGLEPGNHTYITDFSKGMVHMQEKETIVQTDIASFKKNIWLWILNYLYDERGSVFNRKAFLRSSIQQMANHYSISYDELFSLIERALAAIKDTTPMQAGMISVLRELVKDRQDLIREQAIANDSDHWQALEEILNSEAGITRVSRGYVNELFTGLAAGDPQKFSALIRAHRNRDMEWQSIMSGLNNHSVESLLTAIDGENAPAVIVAVRFMHMLAGVGKLAINRDALLQTAVKFLQQHSAPSSFDLTVFLYEAVASIAKKNNLPVQSALMRLASAGVPSSERTAAALNLYSRLFSLFSKEKFSQSSTDQVNDVAGIIRMITGNGHTGILPKEQYTSLQRSLVAAIYADPSNGIKVLIEYPRKKELAHLLPMLLNEYTADILLSHATAYRHHAVLVHLQQRLRRMRSNSMAKAMEKELITEGLQLMILYPRENMDRFFGRLMDSLYKYPASQQNGLLPALLDNRSSGGDASAIPFVSHDVVSKKYAELSQSNFTEKLAVLLGAPQNKRREVCSMLLVNFSERSFIELRKSAGNKRILNYLIPRGAELMHALTKEYAAILVRYGKILVAQQAVAVLNEIFWKCVLRHTAHKGNAVELAKIFKAAASYHFAVPVMAGILPHDHTAGIVDDNALVNLLVLPDGTMLSYASIAGLVTQCLAEGRSSATHNGSALQLDELLVTAFETDARQAIQLIASLPADEKHVRILQSIFSFNRFGSMIAGAGTVLQKAVADIHALLCLFSEAGDGNKIQTENICWNELYRLMRDNSWNSRLANNLIKKIIAGTNCKIQQLSAAITGGNYSFSATMEEAIVMELPEPVTGVTGGIDNTTMRLKTVHRQGILNDIISDIISNHETSLWSVREESVSTAQLLNEIITHHPSDFIAVFRKTILTEQQMKWLATTINFGKMLRAIGSRNRTQQTLLDRTGQLHTLLAHLSVPGMHSRDLQEILFRKILKAWSANDWKMLSPERIWSELVWDACIKKGVSKESLLRSLAEHRKLFPTAWQVSLVRMLEQHGAGIDQPAAVFQKVKKTLPSEKKLEEILKNGITVHNAGMVLLNSYFPMLFERLGLWQDKEFTGPEAAAYAVHCLEYLATGFVTNEEHLLPLNKLLCGIEISEPVTGCTDLDDKDKEIIDGLLEAAIGHWPAAGSTTLNGFRGNWLVRKAILVSLEDKWELMVERKAYDLLLNHSPFSFSIIKYPWMPKPLHVKWTY